VNNAERAKKAEEALQAYIEEQDGDAWIGASDFMADLMHLADAHRWNFGRLIEIAQYYYGAELEEEPPAGSKHDWKPPKVRFKRRRRS
jgi:hypothetical protein